MSMVILFCLVSCGSRNTANAQIDYGNSDLYTKEDMDEAIALIMDVFNTWDGCELHTLTYVSDSQCNTESLAWMNELEAANDAEEVFTQCILFKSSFHTPKHSDLTFNPDQEYTDWQWWLARSEGGKWKLMTMGY